MHKNGKVALVTGGAGFIGSHLVKKLVEVGYSPLVLDNLSSGYIENLSEIADLKFVQGSVTDINLVNSLVKQADVVFHLADFIPNYDSYGPGHIVKYSSDSPLEDLNVCVGGMLTVLEALEKQIKR